MDQSWFVDPHHRLKKYNAMDYELHEVKRANVRLAHKLADRMGSLISEEVDMEEIDLIAELLEGAMVFDWDVSRLLREEGVGSHEHQ